MAGSLQVRSLKEIGGGHRAVSRGGSGAAAVADDFTLVTHQLFDARDTFTEQIRSGLARGRGPIQAYPSFLGVPAPDLFSRPFALTAGDWDGTTSRFTRVRAGPDGVQNGTFSEVLFRPGDSAGQVLSLHSQLLYELGNAHPQLGWVLSFPAEITPDRDAVVKSWNNVLDLPGLEGLRIGHELAQAAAQKGVQIGRWAVLNNAVATLLAGVLAKMGQGNFDPSRLMSTTGGAGHNMAIWIDSGWVPELAALDGPEGFTAVSLDSGALMQPHRNDADRELDKRSIAPGTRHYEKAVEGPHLAELFRLVMPNYQPTPTSMRVLAEVLQDKSQPDAQIVAQAILERAADLRAAGIAAGARLYGHVPGTPPIVNQMGECDVGEVPGFVNRMEDRANQLASLNTPIQVVPPLPHANSVGAAAAVAMSAPD